MSLMPINQKKQFGLFLFLVLVPLAVGTFIYLIFRKDTLYVFQWVEFIGLKEEILSLQQYVNPMTTYLPNWFLYSLPDGIWVFTFTVVLCWIWHKNKTIERKYWVVLPLLLGVTGEIGQYLNLVQGVYCNYDMLSYLFSGFFALAISKYYWGEIK